MTTDTTPKTPLDGLISCGSCGAPMRYDEATEDHEALYVCHQKHRTGTEVRLQAHTTDRLVISGVLSAVLTERASLPCDPQSGSSRSRKTRTAASRPRTSAC